jgi:hypothetical protein
MVELRRIVMAALHVSNRAVDIAVPKLGAALQGRGNVLQERVAVAHSQRPGCRQDGVEL